MVIEKDINDSTAPPPPGPVQEIFDDLWTRQKIRIWIKRDDLIHPMISGNKYRKLDFLKSGWPAMGYKGIVSFGGMYSNHLHALGWFCYENGIPLVVFVRVGDPATESPTIKDLKSWNAEIRYLTPSEYRLKDRPEYLKILEKEFPGYFILPEGGSHPDSQKGIGQMVEEIRNEISRVDYFICPVGTGATLAGIVKAKQPFQKAIGISALKTSEAYLNFRDQWNLGSYKNWVIAEQWHWGGYGKAPEQLLMFIREFQRKFGILLDPLYNGKSMYALFQYLTYGMIPPGSSVVFIHIGGLQG